MKTAAFLAVSAALAASVNAHGQMTKPSPRVVTDWYLSNSGALKNAGEQELEIAPIENLSGRKQADFPEGATFNIENGCRGFIYEEGNTVTTLTPGEAFDVEWWIQAPHPGYMNLSIVKPSTDSAGKITYEKAVTILSIDPFATTGGTDSTTATIPAGAVSGCENAGDCALQFYWHSDVADQTYPSCADIIVSGSGAGTGSSTTTTTAPAATTAAPAASTATSTAASAADDSAAADESAADETDASTGAEADASADDEYADETTAPTVTTAAPAATTAAPASGDKCNARARRSRN